MVGIARALAAVMMLATGCYNPGAKDCSYTCNGGACPSGLTCVANFCRDDPHATGTCSGGDGGNGDANRDVPLVAYEDVVKNDGAFGYWRLGDSVGATMAVNELGGPPALVQDTVAFGAPGAIAFDTNTSARFDESETDCISAGTLPTVDFGPTGAFSIEAWMMLKTSSSSSVRIAIARLMGAPPVGFDLSIGVGGVVTFRTCDGTSCDQLSGGVVMPASTWIHLVATYDGPSSHAVLFVDGGVREQKDLTHPPGMISAPVTFGCLQNTSQADGWLDEIAIYQRVLDGGEVAEHHKVGTGL